MAIKNAQLERLGRTWVYYGIASFVTTGATLELDIPLRKILGWSLTANGAPGTTEILSFDETVSNEMVMRALGTIAGTIRRAATTTSGLSFSFIFFGEP